MFQKRFTNVSTKLSFSIVSIEMFQKCVSHVSKKLFNNYKWHANVSETFYKCFPETFIFKCFDLYVSEMGLPRFKEPFQQLKLHGKCFRPVSETFITKLLKDGHFHISTTDRKRFWHFYWNVSKFQNTRGRNVSDTFRAMWEIIENHHN